MAGPLGEIVFGKSFITLCNYIIIILLLFFSFSKWEEIYMMPFLLESSQHFLIQSRFNFDLDIEL